MVRRKSRPKRRAVSRHQQLPSRGRSRQSVDARRRVRQTLQQARWYDNVRDAILDEDIEGGTR